MPFLAARYPSLRIMLYSSRLIDSALLSVWLCALARFPAPATITCTVDHVKMTNRSVPTAQGCTSSHAKMPSNRSKRSNGHRGTPPWMIRDRGCFAFFCILSGDTVFVDFFFPVPLAILFLHLAKISNRSRMFHSMDSARFLPDSTQERLSA